MEQHYVAPSCMDFIFLLWRSLIEKEKNEARFVAVYDARSPHTIISPYKIFLISTRVESVSGWESVLSVPADGRPPTSHQTVSRGGDMAS